MSPETWRRHRKQKNLTQIEAAAYWGMGRMRYERLEHGRTIATGIERRYVAWRMAVTHITPEPLHDFDGDLAVWIRTMGQDWTRLAEALGPKLTPERLKRWNTERDFPAPVLCALGWITLMGPKDPFPSAWGGDKSLIPERRGTAPKPHLAPINAARRKAAEIRHS